MAHPFDCIKNAGAGFQCAEPRLLKAFVAGRNNFYIHAILVNQHLQRLAGQGRPQADGGDKVADFPQFEERQVKESVGDEQNVRSDYASDARNGMLWS